MSAPAKVSTLSDLRKEMASTKREFDGLTREMCAHLTLIHHFRKQPGCGIAVEFHLSAMAQLNAKVRLCYTHRIGLRKKINACELVAMRLIKALPCWQPGYEARPSIDFTT